MMKTASKGKYVTQVHHMVTYSSSQNQLPNFMYNIYNEACGHDEVKRLMILCAEVYNDIMFGMSMIFFL